MHKKPFGLVLSLLLLQGCASSLATQSKAPNVTSTPAGASVFANGLEIGQTPLKRNLFDDFPAGWRNSIYQAQGTLEIKKQGCKSYSINVTDKILREPIHAELKCKQSSTPVKMSPVFVPKVSIETRLKKLDKLLKKELISEQEYKETRARILSEI